MLRDSGRYAQNPVYIENLAEKFGFDIDDSESVILRHEKGNPMHGYIYLLRKELDK